MSFLVLLLVLLVEKFSSLRVRVQRDGVWLGLLSRLEQRKGEGATWLVLLLLVLLPALLLGLLLWVLEPVAHGWLALPLHVLVVVYALGRGDVLAALGPFRDAWRRGDSQAAWLVAQRDLGVDEDGQALLPAVQRWLVWQAHQSFFVVIFWYALLGPVPVLAYRLLALAEDHAQQPALRDRAAQLRHALDWLPARALVATFGLVGNFVAVSRVLLQELLNWDLAIARLLGEAARAAEGIAEPCVGEAGVATLDDLWQLLVRSAMLWYAAFAVWTLFR